MSHRKLLQLLLLLGLEPNAVNVVCHAKSRLVVVVVVVVVVNVANTAGGLPGIHKTRYKHFRPVPRPDAKGAKRRATRRTGRLSATTATTTPCAHVVVEEGGKSYYQHFPIVVCCVSITSSLTVPLPFVQKRRRSRRRVLLQIL
uniref:Secreted protein n=1 Tax=Anopheles darlingi TaxID=43151 RepID=A0A2M4DCZ4_ANODA